MTTEEVIEAIKTNKNYKIYKSREFRTLRLQVLKTFHYECQRCKESNKITSAVLVHHVQEVTKHPELAFEEFYIDKNGIKQRNLIPLCKDVTKPSIIDMDLDQIRQNLNRILSTKSDGKTPPTP